MVAELTWEDLLAGATLPIQFRGAAPWLLPEANGGTGVLLRTNMGSIRCLFHRAAEATRAVLWVAGVGGGFNGGGGLYPLLSDELTEEGISSLRLSYRKSNSFLDCVLDVVAGVHFLQERGHSRVALVGHSLGGAVVIAAAPLCDAVATVVGLASQTYGAHYVSLVSPRPLLLVHGEADTRLGPHCSQQIFQMAREPKELVLYPGAGHSLRECREQLHPLLKTWLADKLRG
ncbi:MAG: phospholipase/carboxylesterase [Dehalococcoidia bacterium]|nr:phospholipase/carboxylesterase [Dehalococcoidia bacterium]